MQLFHAHDDFVLKIDAISAALTPPFYRCGRTQKAVDLFDAVISKPEDYINGDKTSYSNKEKNELAEISKAFAFKNLKPNIRTYNTVLKALRGYSDFEKCMDVIRVMKANNIDPDTVTMNTLIDAAVVSGNLMIANDVSQLSNARLNQCKMNSHLRSFSDGIRLEDSLFCTLHESRAFTTDILRAFVTYTAHPASLSSSWCGGIHSHYIRYVLETDLCDVRYL